MHVVFIQFMLGRVYVDLELVVHYVIKQYEYDCMIFTASGENQT